MNESPPGILRLDALQIIECFLRNFFGGRLERSRKRLGVLLKRSGESSELVDDATLDFGFGVRRSNSLREARQPVNRCNQDVLYASVF